MTDDLIAAVDRLADRAAEYLRQAEVWMARADAHWEDCRESYVMPDVSQYTHMATACATTATAMLTAQQLALMAQGVAAAAEAMGAGKS